MIYYEKVYMMEVLHFDIWDSIGSFGLRSTNYSRTGI
jgi:hypothetical protein